MSNSTFLYILGPTACGKTELALQAAKKLQWPIINCDSIQVYQQVSIGTAKPTAEDIKRAPHYLFDYVTPPKKLTVADYLEDVIQCLNEHKIDNAIFVGGSGFYIQALEKGLYPNSQTPEAIKQEIDIWIQEKGMPSLYQWIKERDPDYVNKISENDHYRIKRAVEVMKTQNQTMTALKQKMKMENHSPLPLHRSLKVGLSDERDKLRSRVEKRVKKMLSQGLVEEVHNLINQGLSEWPPLASVGYKEVRAYLEGQIQEKDLSEEIITATMQLIKKQQTWFGRDSEIQWFAPEQQKEALQWIFERAQPSS